MEDAQMEAEKKNDVPEQVGTEDPKVQQDAFKEYSEQNEKAKDALKKYGYTDIEQFIGALNSNALFSRAVVLDMLGVSEFKPTIASNTSGAPQEHGITGVLDHSTYPPKLKDVPDASVPDDKPEGTV